MSTNVVAISGNIGAEPELRVTTGGTQILTFGVAVSERKPDGNNGWTNYTNWVDCVMFGSRAASLKQYLHKGMHVSLSGSLSYSSWESNGQRRSKLEVKIADIDFSGSKRESAPAPEPDVYDYDIPFE